MTLLKNAVRRPTIEDAKFQAAKEGRSYAPHDDYWYYPVYTPTASGIDVDEGNALQYTTVWACVRVLSETIASLPLITYKRLASGGKEKAENHPLYNLLHSRPNSEMTSFQLREALMGHVLLWGNAYAEIERDQGDTIIGLWPLRPDRMTVERGTSSDILQYKYRLETGEEKIFKAEEILHIPGLGFNGVSGYSVIAMAREAIGIGRAAEDFAGRFFSNDATPGGVLKHPMKLGEKAHENLKKSLTEAHTGPKNRWKPLILEEGMSWEGVGMPLKDAEFLETRKFQTIEICRIYNVPPYKVMDFDRATFSNVEQTAIDWVVHGVRPWLVRLEQAYLVKLFNEREQKKYFAEHLVDGLLRGDLQSRYNAYAIARNWGWMSADDIREKENMNPLPDGQGKMYLVPMNMVSADKAGELPVQKPAIKAEPKEEPEEEPEEEEMSDEERQELKNLRSLKIEADARILAIKSDFDAKLAEKDRLINEISGEKQREIDKLNAQNVTKDEMTIKLREEIASLKAQLQKLSNQGFKRLFEDAVGRIVRRESIAVRRAIQRKDMASFEAYLDDFYKKDLPEFASNTLQPSIMSYAEVMGSTGGTNCLSKYVSGHIKESRNEISKWVGVLIHDTTDFRKNEQGIEDSLLVWAEKRPERAANTFQAFFATS